ncbi:MAG: glycosyltransferase family 4 protein [Candidatus Kerfeldbacteria bacterium]|nr:glycosyltransferase family 4 protein [Candidatus Kerfeldbacteria bacterium]
MRIIIDARLYGTYHRGLGRYLKGLIAELTKLDKINTYLILINPNNPEQPAGLGDNLTLIKTPWRQYTIREQLFLPGLIKKLKADLVHWPHINVPLLGSTPFIVTVHDLIINHFPDSRATTLPKWYYRFKLFAYKLIVKRSLQRTQKIIAVSRATAADISNYYPFTKNKIQVIYPGLGQPAPAAVIQNLPANYFLAVGAAYPHKNLESLLIAWSKALTALPPSKLIIVGRTDFFMERLKEFAQKLKIDQEVIFWGEASEAELTALYQKSAGYILPSLAEGFGFGPLEALLQGIPLAVADIPVMHEVLGEVPIYFNPRVESEISASLVKLNTACLLNESIIKNILNRYNWPAAARVYLKIYQDLTSNEASTGSSSLPSPAKHGGVGRPRSSAKAEKSLTEPDSLNF